MNATTKQVPAYLHLPAYISTLEDENMQFLVYFKCPKSSIAALFRHIATVALKYKSQLQIRRDNIKREQTITLTKTGKRGPLGRHGSLLIG